MERVTIYGRYSCGFCVGAKNLCERKGFDFQFVDMIAEDMTKADIEKIIGKPVMTVPQILVGQQHIGGYDQFSAWVRDRETAGVQG
ncbi:MULTISPECIES: GrxA family glutaredoxin [Marinobacter]|uniref:GrxA family glutaredoxin n=1 Tax=Marinobacter profundi TaxID=2666256 RepID=A0A2G1UKN4_9GAMM|nr:MULTISPECIES: GrxA family glutaredoxin [Marinobacter]MBD3657836.1 GrxA family glutaredoxin [Marinobacter sp.]PHQ14979.1 GrxA family glutaredoxin [Marinobacter profundi]